MRTVILLAVLLCEAGARASAQEVFPDSAPPAPSAGLAFGMSLDVAVPLGQFAQVAPVGGALNFPVTWRPSLRSTLGLRAELGLVIYGSETFRTPLLNSTPLVLVDVTTTNNIYTLSVGPQLTYGRGPFRPYLTGTAGLGVFSTETDVSGSENIQPFAWTVNFEDATFALSGGGGAYYVVSTRKRISLETSVRYYHYFAVQYLHRGGIRQGPGNTVFFDVHRSPVDLLVVRLGIAFGNP